MLIITKKTSNKTGKNYLALVFRKSTGFDVILSLDISLMLKLTSFDELSQIREPGDFITRS